MPKAEEVLLRELVVLTGHADVDARATDIACVHAGTETGVAPGAVRCRVL